MTNNLGLSWIKFKFRLNRYVDEVEDIASPGAVQNKSNAKQALSKVEVEVEVEAEIHNKLQ